MNGRAITEKQKRATIELILASWLARPELRLGQLLVNTVDVVCPELFYAEDDALARSVVEFANKTAKAPTE